ncbi:MBL fold metallo-hydrolase [Lutibacter sp.]|uniref:MBL fold metallo-hydrolase n=1 Tax=Lutibacter sp. TaxID=1925666 RepID=UPI00273558BA|nr:MBL fold metallo-hydrolase [Lutibacter sp.]MDP3314241.1 MBL fold metallo-hydrolase [Lutibacter sp.]
MKFHVLSIALTLLIGTLSFGQNSNIDHFKTNKGNLTIQPILHGSAVLTYKQKTIYVDPYGGSKLYKGLDAPDIILITDIHGDHLHQSTLDSLDISNAIFIVPQEVAKKLPETYKSKIIILNNGQAIHRFNFFIKAIPMYNLPETEDSRHPKGRGNGYVIDIDSEKRVYFSGDTEDIDEMRMLQNIDIAFICMNLPFTMSIDQAASAVLEFQPKIVYPYHYRGTEGLSDIEAFKKLITSENKQIEVRLKNWYPKD